MEPFLQNLTVYDATVVRLLNGMANNTVSLRDGHFSVIRFC